LSFCPDEDVFTLDAVDHRPTDAGWHQFNRDYNDLAMRFGGRPFLNQTKQLSRAVVGAHSAPVGMRSVSSSPPRIKTGDSGTVSSMRCSRPMARVPLVSPGGTLAGGGGSSESTTLRAIRCWAGRR
jgi:hypothetical protein